MMSLGGYRRASNTRRVVVVTHSARFLRLECPIISRQFVSEKTKQMKEEERKKERKKNRMGLRRKIRPKLREICAYTCHVIKLLSTVIQPSSSQFIPMRGEESKNSTNEKGK